MKGFAMGAGTVYEDWVRFGCERGYELVGEDRLLCNESGTWSAAVPTCQRKTPIQSHLIKDVVQA